MRDKLTTGLLRLAIVTIPDFFSRNKTPAADCPAELAIVTVPENPLFLLIRSPLSG